MKSYVSTMLTGIVVLTASATFATEVKSKKTIPGYVSHGINVYNNQFIADYSEDSPLVPWLNPIDPVKEIGVFAPGADNADPIIGDTGRNLPVATIDGFVNFFNPGSTFDRNLLNKTLDQIGTNFFGFGSIDQRIPIKDFSDAKAGDTYRASTANPRPTVADWEKISGKLDVICRDDGTAKVRVSINNGFPNGLYSLWDIGALNPLTDQEQGYGIPFGGLPNVLLTDNDGCAVKEFEVSYCPTRACEAGAESCSSYASAFYHWDGQIYGGSPAATFAGVPAGVVSANHIVWPLSGTTLMDPKTKFKGKASCNTKKLRKHRKSRR